MAPRGSTPASSRCWGAAARATCCATCRRRSRSTCDAFNALIAERRVRPTALLPFWHLAGFALGARPPRWARRPRWPAPSRSRKPSTRTTRAQIDALDDDEPELRETVEKFRAEELEHRDIGLDHGAEQAPGLSAAVPGDQGRLPRRHRAQRAGLQLIVLPLVTPHWRQSQEIGRPGVGEHFGITGVATDELEHLASSGWRRSVSGLIRSRL